MTFAHPDTQFGNPFQHALRHGPAQVGLWLSLASDYAAEVCATAGFDWVLIDGEHAPNDVRSVLAQLQAVAPYRSHPVVRIVQGDAAVIKQMLDIGVRTLLVPMVDTAEQAAAATPVTRRCRPPSTARSVPSRPAARLPAR